MAESLDKIVGKVPKFRTLKGIWSDLDRLGAVPDFLKLLGNLVKGDQPAAKRAAAGILDKVRRKPDEAAVVGGRLVVFFLDLLPPGLKARLAAKMGGRKIPVIGTVIVGIFDIAAIASNPTDWKNWAGLGSTAAGLIPVAGTAVSIAVDLAVLFGTIIDAAHNLSTAHPNGSPFR